MRAVYKTIADLPGTLPVFPLAGVIMLPRAPLPLNIFEPRYLAMIDAAMSGNRIIGIIQPMGEGGASGSPQSSSAVLSRVGCAGRITTYQELDDGRMLIGLTGLARFTPKAEVTAGTPFRVFEINYVPFAADLIEGDGEDEVDRERLIAALKKFLTARQATADWKKIGATPSEQLVNWLALGSPFANQEKQALLEVPTLKERAAMLIALAEMDLASGGNTGDPGARMQ